MQLFVGLIVAGLHFLAAYFVWKKGKVQILAGYVEGQVKDKKRLSKYAGIYLIGLGIIFIFVPLLPDHLYIVMLFYVLWIVVGAVIINVKIK
ncbi:DUF3784 domain-containing protein [Pradoshia sp. D12]|uniref:DUF3784 domain-containing protein n=1 Tax=Bacillaceae TaxID=186817 RepID=UPI0011297D6B|nr:MULTISPECIES: DUF3784 domain-containing protein [Bacillaceae]QFK72378.1 DUF3784 domain-containing protein [Pradoshia sp. D12]QFK72384.1 DUF3784 domain-containing protein [Pradoshia sp. D12]TPF71122.1 DUF3784 domain-containing protein [Bacillus sp. D12]TPF71128.1 DUF3784 domain-containing protein [Bacillus sp. D12]